MRVGEAPGDRHALVVRGLGSHGVPQGELDVSRPVQGGRDIPLPLAVGLVGLSQTASDGEALFEGGERSFEVVLPKLDRPDRPEASLHVALPLGIAGIDRRKAAA